MCVIRDTIKGVSELHELNILHQQLHLEHILVTLDGRLRVKICGFSKSTHVPGDEKLESLAPGTIEGQGLLLDLSQLGWLLFHCFTFGQHISNRFLQESDLHFLDHSPEGRHLINSLINRTQAYKCDIILCNF